MGKLPVLSGREACAILAAEGFAEVRRRGSHVVMQKRDQQTTVTVVVPDHAEREPWPASFDNPALPAAASRLAEKVCKSAAAGDIFVRHPDREESQMEANRRKRLKADETGKSLILQEFTSKSTGYSIFFGTF